ncbi:MAG: LPS assembly lipoprotein LptE [Pseudomonadota bacterium]
MARPSGPRRVKASAACWLALLVLTLGGCGFQLQGEAELPEEMVTTSISSPDPYSQFVRRLTILLEQNGVSVVDGGRASARLEVPVDSVRTEVLSIGDSARVREFRVVHRVRFQLVDADGTVLVPEQTLEQSRVISFDESDILAATREEEFLREELADSLSKLVLRRLGTSGA